jgi:hypothetical protein
MAFYGSGLYTTGFAYPGSQPYIDPYSYASYPSTIPATSAAEPETNSVLVSPEEYALEVHQRQIRATETELVQVYNALENQNQAQSLKINAETADLMNRGFRELVTYDQKLQAIKRELASPELSQKVRDTIKRDLEKSSVYRLPPGGFPTLQHQTQEAAIPTVGFPSSAPAPNQPDHPISQLKKLQQNVTELRKALQTLADDENTY